MMMLMMIAAVNLNGGFNITTSIRITSSSSSLEWSHHHHHCTSTFEVGGAHQSMTEEVYLRHDAEHGIVAANGRPHFIVLLLRMTNRVELGLK